MFQQQQQQHCGELLWPPLVEDKKIYNPVVECLGGTFFLIKGFLQTMNDVGISPFGWHEPRAKKPVTNSCYLLCRQVTAYRYIYDSGWIISLFWAVLPLPLRYWINCPLRAALFELLVGKSRNLSQFWMFSFISVIENTSLHISSFIYLFSSGTRFVLSPMRNEEHNNEMNEDIHWFHIDSGRCSLPYA